MRDAGNHRPAVRGFTLVELLVVIIVIGLLAAIGLTVGGRVIAGGRASQTQDILRVLETGLSNYIGEELGDLPPAVYEFEDSMDQARKIPVIDGQVGPFTNEVGRVSPSLGLYLASITREGAPAPSELTSLDPALLAQVTLDDTLPSQTTVLDPFGLPIRFVHPFWHGEVVDGTRAEGERGDPVDLTMANNGYLQNATTDELEDYQFVRRNAFSDADRAASPGLVGDSDGGRAPGGRPYFYSAGPDGNPATTDDNIYLTSPTLP